MIQLNLDHLNSPEKAFAMVRQSRSPAGAKLVARFCQGIGDTRSAVEFLLLANLGAEALALAQEHDEMEVYADVLGPAGTNEDCTWTAIVYRKHVGATLSFFYYYYCVWGLQANDLDFL